MELLPSRSLCCSLGHLHPSQDREGVQQMDQVIPFDPMTLLDIDGAVLIEIVDGEYRIEKLQEAATTSGSEHERRSK